MGDYFCKRDFRMLSPPLQAPSPLRLAPPPSNVGAKRRPSDDTISPSRRHAISIIIIIVALYDCRPYYMHLCLEILGAERTARGRQIFSFNDTEEVRNVESLQYASLNDFSPSTTRKNKCGFGAVYKGKLAQCKEIAVKRLATGSGQGDLEFGLTPWSLFAGKRETSRA
uniref:Uncharacterized protein n=1 Tax=Kalanchoe fedtschenkoi TaxID=63787 RepID=A0A7N0U5X0_KALFE